MRKEQEPGLIGIGTIPSFAIGERALLIQHEQGNVLWDCMSLIDDETVAGNASWRGMRTRLYCAQPIATSARYNVRQKNSDLAFSLLSGPPC